MSSTVRITDPSIAIPPPPRRAGPGLRPAAPGRRWRLRSAALIDALREASLVGLLTLAFFWGLAELAFVLLPVGATGPG